MSRIRIRLIRSVWGHPDPDPDFLNQIRIRIFQTGSGKKWTGSATLVKTIPRYARFFYFQSKSVYFLNTTVHDNR